MLRPADRVRAEAELNPSLTTCTLYAYCAKTIFPRGVGSEESEGSVVEPQQARPKSTLKRRHKWYRKIIPLVTIEEYTRLDHPLFPQRLFLRMRLIEIYG